MDSRSTDSYGNFYPFPRLPRELRCLIWKFARFPRTVEVVRGMRRTDSTEDVTVYLVSRSPVPAVMHACRESRSDALYTKAFTTDGNPEYTWFDFHLDTLHISEYALENVKTEETKLLQKAIVQVSDTEWFWFYTVGSTSTSRMKALKELLLVSEVPLWKWGNSNGVGGVQRAFHKLFGREKGWVCPKIKIIEKNSGQEWTDQDNHQEKGTQLVVAYRWEKFAREMGCEDMTIEELEALSWTMGPAPPPPPLPGSLPLMRSDRALD